MSRIWAGRTSSIATTATARSSEFARGAGVPGPGQGFPTWFFDYDNDGFQDIFVGIVRHVRRRSRARLPPAAAQRQHAEAVPKPRRRQLPGRDAPGRARQGADGDGRELRRHRQRRLSRHLSRDRQPVVRRPSCRACCCATKTASRSWTSRARRAPASCTRVMAWRSPIWITTATRKLSSRSAAPRPAMRTHCGCSRTRGIGSDWIALELVGVKTNRAAIGARITVTVEGEGGRRDRCTAASGSGGSFGASPLQQHIGLGAERGRVDVEVWWPTSNTRQHFSNVGQEPVRRDHRVRRQSPSGAADAAAAAAANGNAHISDRVRRSAPSSSRSRVVALAADGDGPCRATSRRHAMRGMVLTVDAARKTVVVSHDSVPGVMPAMTMPFEVREREGAGRARARRHRRRSRSSLSKESAHIERIASFATRASNRIHSPRAGCACCRT